MTLAVKGEVNPSIDFARSVDIIRINISVFHIDNFH